MMNKYLIALSMLCAAEMQILVARDLLIENNLDKPVKVAYTFVAGRARSIGRGIFDSDFVDIAARSTKTIPVAEQPKDKPSPYWQRVIAVTTEQDLGHI